VRLRVVRPPLGPLTYGWRRPTIVMPQALVSSCSHEAIKLLVAHELVHVRRGDAWIGLLQVIAGVVWWFHPLVWWANRRIAFERERCCDEEVVAGLACQPACYVRGLMSVLELKRQLRPLPALPGVRAFEINKQRLEHLMSNQQFLPRMPRRYWLLLLAGILLIGPGAKAPTENATDAPTPLRVTPLISPNGQRIAYGQVAVGANGQQRVRIIVGNVDGSNRRALPIETEAVDEVQWYGNDRIAYVTRHGQDGYLLMDFNGKPAGRLTMPAGCDSYFHQCLSPDGRWIAYCGNYAGIPTEVNTEQARRDFLEAHPQIKQQHGLFAVNLENQTVKHLLAETVANQPAWSADSKYLAAGIGHYVASYPLVIVNVETGEVQKPDVKAVGVSWSPAGTHLAMTTEVVRGGSWRGGIPLDGALGVWDVSMSKRTLVSPPGANVSVKEPYSWILSGSHSPVWSGDGKWIAYQRSESATQDGRREQRQELWIVRSDGSEGRKVLNHAVRDLAWSPDGRTLVWVAEGRLGRTDLELDATALGPTPAAPDGAFCIEGRVIDHRGQPLEGVAVRVARGMGSLHSTQPVMTGADGRYRIHFGPGMHSEGANAQFAIASAHKAGWYEKGLGRQGNLGMANYKPKGFNEQDWQVAGMVYPGNPYRLDFTMHPAAKADVQLVDRDGKPLAQYHVRLTGDLLYPASSVLSSGKTDKEGRLTIDNVPLATFWFTVGSRRAEYKTAPIAFDAAEPVRLRLIYDDLAGTLTAERL
jgi:Tol biopolymer transport system component